VGARRSCLLGWEHGEGVPEARHALTPRPPGTYNVVAGIHAWGDAVISNGEVVSEQLPVTDVRCFQPLEIDPTVGAVSIHLTFDGDDGCTLQINVAALNPDGG
jgi:hypothetical protein